MNEPFPLPWNDGAPSYQQRYLHNVHRLDHQIQLQALKRIEQELARHMRAQRVIDDIKAACGVTNGETK